jgi:hypothetical protein
MEYNKTKSGMVSFIRTMISNHQGKIDMINSDLEDGIFETRFRVNFPDTEEVETFIKALKDIVKNELNGDMFECKQVHTELRCGFNFKMMDLEESYSINEAFQFTDIKADLAAAKELALILGTSKKKSLTGKRKGQSNYSYASLKDYAGIPTVFRTEFLDWGNGLLSSKSTLKTAFIFVINGFVYYPKSTNRGIVPGVKGMSVDEFKAFIVSNKD